MASCIIQCLILILLLQSSCTSKQGLIDLTDDDNSPPLRKKKAQIDELDPVRCEIIKEAQARFAAALVTKEAYPRDHVEDEMVYRAFCDAVNEYAHKNGEEVGDLGVFMKLSPAEWKLVSTPPFSTLHGIVYQLDSSIDSCASIARSQSYQSHSP